MSGRRRAGVAPTSRRKPFFLVTSPAAIVASRQPSRRPDCSSPARPSALARSRLHRRLAICCATASFSLRRLCRLLQRLRRFSRDRFGARRSGQRKAAWGFAIWHIGDRLGSAVSLAVITVVFSVGDRDESVTVGCLGARGRAYVRCGGVVTRHSNRHCRVASRGAGCQKHGAERCHDARRSPFARLHPADFKAKFPLDVRSAYPRRGPETSRRGTFVSDPETRPVSNPQAWKYFLS